MGYQVVYITCFGRLHGEFVHYMIQNQRSANACGEEMVWSRHAVSIFCNDRGESRWRPKNIVETRSK